MENIKKKCLFLCLDDKEFDAVETAKRGIKVAQIYKQIPIIMRIIRRIHAELGLPGISIWLPSWKKDLQKFDTVIIYASKLTPPVVKFIRKKRPSIRIIVWYRNPVDKCVSLNKFRGLNCEIWSFDEEDCNKYKLKYNTQYYFNNITLKPVKNEFDVFFVGIDKGRMGDLMRLDDKLNALGISHYFHITPAEKVNKAYRNVYQERIPYAKVLEYISKCKAILDYVSEKQSGLTLRPLEAIFFQKKLITNDKTITKRDFYKKNNIFILGKDNIDELPRFLNIPYELLEEEIINKYDFNSWFGRFFCEKE